MTALEFFQQEDIHWLPVEPQEIIRRKGFMLYSYKRFSRLTGKTVEHISALYGEDGFSMTVGDRYLIVYNDSQIKPRTRWTLMHELSHVVLGHLDACGGSLARSPKKDRYDRHADFFTANVLAPLPVLKKCNARNPEMISRMTGLSLSASGFRSKELSSWHLSRKELNAYEQQFSEYIEYVVDGDFLTDWNCDNQMNYFTRAYHRRSSENRLPAKSFQKPYSPSASKPYSPIPVSDEKFDSMIDRYYDPDKI